MTIHDEFIISIDEAASILKLLPKDRAESHRQNFSDMAND